jgi:WXG100 family type VII secretion target
MALSVFSLEAMTELTSIFSGATATISDQVGQLTTQISQMSEDWEGEAASAYHSLFRRWLTLYNQTTEELEFLTRVLDRAIVNHRAASNANVRIWH